jgi:two-component system chemotaxis response regulator CheB
VKPAVSRGSSRRAIRVLVVDDSAVMRRFMSALLSQESAMEVETAADPLIALRKMERWRPDVILLDLEMPRMNGMTFLRRVMRDDPIPVVVCSSHTGPGTDTALQALEEGAVEVIAKPEVGIQEFLHESALVLIDALRAAHLARVDAPRAQRLGVSRPLTADAVLPAKRASGAPRAGGETVIALGASTGGPEALTALLQALPADAPAAVLVQHMPKAFTGPFAARLSAGCAVEVREARQGDEVRRGRVLVAPGDQHLVLRRRGTGYEAQLIDGALVCRHRPSVDVLFRSVAQAAGANAVGVILTGMGNDGAAGLLEMRQAGAATLGQDEATSVVFGMAREAAARGAVEQLAPLARLPALILQSATRLARRAG